MRKISLYRRLKWKFGRTPASLAKAAVLFAALGLSSCSSYHEICCGYKWLDGGGSEISIVGPTGNIIVQKVTLISLIENDIVGETYELDQERDTFKISSCSYFRINTNSNTTEYFSNLSDLEADSGVEIRNALTERSINSNSYSCLLAAKSKQSTS